MTKLQQLADSEGLTITELMVFSMVCEICMGICMNKDCDYTTEVEPDQSKGFCEECETNTVKSALILAGLI